jgi:hypothetical protein
MRIRTIALPFVSLTLVLAAVQGGDIEREPVKYSDATPANAVTSLQERLARGKARLEYDPDSGYLKSMLRELNVPVHSQVLVFSKTSLQRSRISPKTPRAVYFNDEVYLGYCLRGNVMEISVADPALGTVFYTLDQEEADKPVFTRQTESCLVCHGSSHNHGLPGHLVRSVHPDRSGEPILASGSYRTDQASPFQERWGGWYVTGRHGSQTHMGNRIYQGRRGSDEAPAALPSQNVTDLAQHFTTGLHLSPHSDIVALMVLEHQAGMHNRIARATLETRMAQYYQEELNKSLHEKPGTVFDSTRSRIKSVGDELVKYLLFAGEARLSAPVSGTSGFAEAFSTRGPADAQGRSLRQLDLTTRLFKYPCSYLIYSPCFDQMPSAVKEYVLRKLFDVLSDKDPDKAYAHLSKADRTAIREILLATKPNLPTYWRK